MKRFGERLHDAVVGDSDRFMPPGFGALDQFFDINQAVHVAHQGMSVQFDALFGAVVLPFSGEIVN